MTSDFGLYEPSTEDRGRVRICGRAQLDGLQKRGRSNEAAAPNAGSLRDEQRSIWRCAREGESRENVKFQSRRRGWYVKRKRGRCRCTGGAEREDNVGIRYGSIKDLKDKREGVRKCLCGGGVESATSSAAAAAAAASGGTSSTIVEVEDGEACVGEGEERGARC